MSTEKNVENRRIEPAAARAGTVVPEDPRYVFEIDYIKCLDRTNDGDDGNDGDEIYAKISLLNSPLPYDTLFTQSLHGMSKGKVKFFDNYTRTITPKVVHHDTHPDDTLFGYVDAWSIDRTGVSGDQSFSVSLFEEDGGEPLGGDDDPIGTEVISFTSEGLAADLTVPGASKGYRRTLTSTTLGASYEIQLVVHRVN